MKLSDAAKILNIPVRELIDKMTKAVPQTTWKADTVLPQEFVEQLNVHSQEYQQVSGLPKQEAQNAIEAVGESGVILNGLDFAISQSLADERTEQLLIETAYRAIARQISNSIPELEISLFSYHGWEWKTKEGESANWHETPLDALIDFVYVILMDNKRLMKEAENND